MKTFEELTVCAVAVDHVVYTCLVYECVHTCISVSSLTLLCVRACVCVYVCVCVCVCRNQNVLPHRSQSSPVPILQ